MQSNQLNNPTQDQPETQTTEPTFDWQPVYSSHINAAAYNRELRELRVSFNDGAVWAYHDVDYEIFETLMGAESAGRYMHLVVKPVYGPGQRLS